MKKLTVEQANHINGKIQTVVRTNNYNACNDFHKWVDDNTEQEEPCPICKGRKIMDGMYLMIDDIPEIGSDIYDDGIANIINELDDTRSTWHCMCEEE